MAIRKKTAILMVFILMLSMFALPSHSIMAKTEDEDPAVLLMAAAHARITGISDIDKLKGMKSGYQDHYDKLLQNPNLDQDQKKQVAAIRDGKIAALDSRIDKLVIAEKSRRRARSPIGILGSFLRGGKKLLQRTGHVIGRGIVSAGKTAIRMIRDPRQLIQSAVLMVATGSASGFKDAVVSIIKSEFNRELKKVTYGELARIAYANPTFKKAIELKDFLDIKGNDDLELALNEHYKKQAEKEAEGRDETDDHIDDEGEDDYDDPDHTAQQLLSDLAERNRTLKLDGAYTCTTINIIPVTDAHLDELKAAGLIWSGFADVAKNISLSREAVQGEMSQAVEYLGSPEQISDGRLSLSKNGDEVEAKLSFSFIPDMVSEKLEKIEEKKYRYIHQKETYLTEYVSFDLDSLVPDVLYTRTKESEQHGAPWSVTLNVTFMIDEEGYLVAEGTYVLDHYTSFVVSEYAYYYGYFASEYSFRFMSDAAVR